MVIILSIYKERELAKETNLTAFFNQVKNVYNYLCCTYINLLIYEVYKSTHYDSCISIGIV